MHIPKNAEIHIQNSAPGPPTKSAPVTPAMFPVPTVPARAVVTAWNGERFTPSSLALFLNREPTVLLKMYPNFVIWINPVLMLK